jgi:hypothetical protein
MADDNKRRPLTIKEMLRDISRREKPEVKYDPEKPERFWAELRTQEEWQLSKIAECFQLYLGMGDKIKVAAEIFKRLNEYMGEDLWEHGKDGKRLPKMTKTIINKKTGEIISEGIPQTDEDGNQIDRPRWDAGTILDWLIGGDDKQKITRYDREALFMICMALDINGDDEEKLNGREIFNLAGLVYERFADPMDVAYVWALEKSCAYQQFICLRNIIAKIADIDLKAVYDKKIRRMTEYYDEDDLIEMADGNGPPIGFGEEDEREIREIFLARREETKNKYYDLIRETDPLDYMRTDVIDEAIRDVWNAGSTFLEQRKALITRVKELKDEFHYCSITRAEKFEELLEIYAKQNPYAFSEYRDKILGYEAVDREDIIDLALKTGCKLGEVNQWLKEANFPYIDLSVELVGRIISDKDFMIRRDKNKNPVKMIEF